MRLLLIEEDAARCDYIRERLASWRPQAQLTVHSPVSQGALAPEFLAQGFDAVLLADSWPGGRGLNWARELASRAGFAPLVLLTDADLSAAREACALGAYTLSREELERDTFAQVLVAAERLHDLGVSDEHAWLVMEYFELGDLRRRMRASLAPREALRLAAAIARSLAAVHGAGVLHRDLKPGNIMLRHDGSVALIDFGLSKDLALALDLTDSGTIFGTPHYMSPEQGHAEPLDARSDLYSLGVILFEMLTGQKPYRAENPMAIVYKHRKEPIPRLPAQFEAVQPLLERLLAKTPADRIATAEEAAEALQHTLDAWLARGISG